MAQEITVPYVLGLTFDLDRQARALAQELEAAEARGDAVDVQLGIGLGKYKAVQQIQADARAEATEAGRLIGECHGKMTPLHRERAVFQRKSAELADAMAKAQTDELRRSHRRARATQLVQIEDRDKALAKLQQQVDTARARLETAEATLLREGDEEIRLNKELHVLQSQLPVPELYVQRSMLRLGLAHANLFIEHNVERWQREVRQAARQMLSLHQALSTGRYRLDTNSEVLGGRAPATSEAMYGAIAVADADLARRIFAEATAPNMVFHQIFHVFRTWCVGLFITKQVAALEELCTLHQFSQGARGGYAQAFLGLLRGDPLLFARGWRGVVVGSWDIWSASDSPGLGLVNLPAMALLRLAQQAGLALPPLNHPSTSVHLWTALSMRSTRPRGR